MTGPGLRDNRAQLVRTAVAGRIAPPRIHPESMAYDRDGRAVWLPGTGGIALGVHAGDPTDAWEADHLMPGASIEDEGAFPAVAGPLHMLSCVGNVVRDAAGQPLGRVAGKRGGLAPGFWPPQLVGVEMPDDVAEACTPGDRIVVEAVGRGLALSDFSEIALANLSPWALDALPLRVDDGKLVCAVAAVLPPAVLGAGLGQDSWIGDVEIADDRSLVGDATALRFGDLISLNDVDSRTTRFYHPGHVSIGLVSHGPSPQPGHGIGVTILLTGPATRLQCAIHPGAGLGVALREGAAASLPSDLSARTQAPRSPGDSS